MALAMIGAANWVIWWYRPTNDDTPEQVADVLVEMLLAGARQGTPAGRSGRGRAARCGCWRRTSATCGRR